MKRRRRSRQKAHAITVLFTLRAAALTIGRRVRVRVHTAQNKWGAGFGPAPHQTGAAKNPMARANSMKPPKAQIARFTGLAIGK
jgi:hypothetical protein